MNKATQTVILTGVNGFLGSWLARGLLESGYCVKGLKRQSSKLDRVADIESQISWLDIDMASGNDLSAFIVGGDVVINTVGNYCRQGEAISDVVEANLLFGLKVFEAAINAGIPCFINAASSLPKSTNYYSMSKAQFSEWGKILSLSHSIMFINVLLEHMYGPGDDEVKFVEYVINACITNKPELELTQGTQARDFIYIEDVVSAFLALIEKRNVLGESKYYDIPLGSGDVTSVRSLVQMVKLITGSNTLLKFGAVGFSQTEIMYSVADIDKFRALGWRPEVKLKEGLKFIIDKKKRLT